MTKHQIISQLYESREVDDCISKMIPIQDRDDFKQELFIILLEKEGIEGLHQRGELLYYIVSVIIKLSVQERNVYHKTYRDKRVQYDTEKVLFSQVAAETESFIERMAREDKEIEFLKELEGIDGKIGKGDYPFYESLIRQIDQYGSMSETSRQTGIPKTSIHRAVTKVRAHLNKIK